jgi:hypothetical protein
VIIALFTDCTGLLQRLYHVMCFRSSFFANQIAQLDAHYVSLESPISKYDKVTLYMSSVNSVTHKMVYMRHTCKNVPCNLAATSSYCYQLLYL